MNRIANLFSQKKKNILNIYCTAGYPKINSTIEVLNALQKYGADMIEIGIPYSDPIADGPVIQNSNMLALKNGITIQKLFDQLKNFRTANAISGSEAGNMTLPVILMGYLNPVMQYGIEKFCQAAKDTGIDGIILPDLPLFEFENEYQLLFKKYGLDFIFLITPETSEERIKKIDALSTGFIYAVSSSSTTGNNTDIDQQQQYFKKLTKMDLKNPVLVGFGIKDKQTFTDACRYTNGAIIGSAYIKALAEYDNIETATKQFLNKILK